VKTITNNRGPMDNTTMMKINDKLSCNLIDTVDAFNNYFSSIAENNNASGYSFVNNKDFYFIYIKICITHFQR
jgi:hypothetical protein